MVLGGDDTLRSAHHTGRLVVAAVAVFELVGRSACRAGEQLVAHTDAEDRLVPFEGLSDVADGLFAELRIARTVGNEKAVIVQGGEIIVPRDPYDPDSPADEAAEDIVLDAAVHKDDGLVAFAVGLDFLAADQFYLVLKVRVLDRKVFFHALRNYHSEHRAVVAQHLGDSPGVHAPDARDALLLHPGIQAADSVPVAVFV